MYQTISFKNVVLAIAIIFLTGACASTPTLVEIDRIEFSGDGSPQVSSRDAFSGELKNLSENESLVIARAKDGSGALSQPTSASIIVVEPELKGDSDTTFNRWLKRCDIDSDGLLDRHCPELFNALDSSDELSNSQFVSFKSWYSINSNPSIDKDYWGSIQTLNTADSKSKRMPVTLKLLTVNLGNKVFEGDLDLVVNIPPRVELGEISLASKVASKAAAKAAVNTTVEVLGILAGVPIASNLGDSFFDDYSPIKSNAKFDITGTTEKRVLVKVSDINLKPNQGATIEFNSFYQIID